MSKLDKTETLEDSGVVLQFSVVGNYSKVELLQGLNTLVNIPSGQDEINLSDLFQFVSQTEKMALLRGYLKSLKRRTVWRHKFSILGKSSEPTVIQMIGLGVWGLAGRTVWNCCCYEIGNNKSDTSCLDSQFNEDVKPEDAILHSRHHAFSAQKQLEVIKEMFSLGYFTLNENKELVEANKGLINLLGFQSYSQVSEAFKRKSCWPVEGYSNRFDINKNIDQEQISENIWIGNDGQQRIMREYLHAEMDQTGMDSKIIGWIEEKRNKSFLGMELGESDRSFELLAEHIEDIIWMMDGKTNELVYINTAVEKLCGVNRNRLYENNYLIFDKVVPADRIKLIERFNHYLKSEEFVEYSFRISTQSGDYRWTKAKVSKVYDQMGNLSAHVGIASDITFLKDAEVKLKENLEFEKQLGQLKTRFVSTASHEFRTPLASIMALTETLMAYWSKLTDEEISKRFQKIMLHINQMQIIISDMLNLTKIQEGHIKLNLHQLDIVSLIDEVITELSYEQEMKHQLIWEMKPSKCELFSDAFVLRQIFQNLFSNAIKYSPDQTKIKIGIIDMATTFEFYVEDSGIGIPDEEVQKLSEPFYRASNTGQIKGSGLGLSIVKASVKLLNGTFEIKSRLNVGTRVSCGFIKTKSDKYEENFGD